MSEKLKKAQKAINNGSGTSQPSIEHVLVFCVPTHLQCLDYDLHVHNITKKHLKHCNFGAMPLVGGTLMETQITYEF